MVNEAYQSSNQIEELIYQEMQILIRRDVTRKEIDFELTPE